MCQTKNMRYTVHFHGRVQGVGFRVTVIDLAKNRPLTGSVRNLPNGSVELIVEGEVAELDQLLEDIKRVMWTNIVDMKLDRSEAAGNLEPLHIAY